MEYKPKISVIMPTYNRAYIIQNAIRSVIDQSFKDWELIIVDDGSTDGTKRIVEGFANPRIKYFQLPHSGNISQVRNEGIKRASADVLVVHDSDDQALPDRLDEIYKVFEEHPDTDVVYHGMYNRFFDPYHNAISRLLKPAQPYDKERLLSEQYIPGQIAYKRETVMRIPYNEQIPLCDDYMLLLELALNNCKFVPIFRQLYDYVESPDSVNVSGEVSGQRKKDVSTMIQILKDKYGVSKVGALIKSTTSGDLISREIIV